MAKMTYKEALLYLAQLAGSGGGGGGGDSPARSVNGKIGAVVLTAADVGATTAAQVNNMIEDKFSGVDSALDRLEGLI